MHLPRILAIVTAVAVAGPAAADSCPRDPQYPVELPWFACPASVAPASCRGCIMGTNLQLGYPDLPPSLFAGVMAGLLGAAQWTVDSVTRPATDVTPRPPAAVDSWVVVAHHGHDRASFVIEASGGGSQVRLGFAPG